MLGVLTAVPLCCCFVLLFISWRSPAHQATLAIAYPHFDLPGPDGCRANAKQKLSVCGDVLLLPAAGCTTGSPGRSVHTDMPCGVPQLVACHVGAVVPAALATCFAGIIP
jgi:hypothetical protein